MPFMSYRYIEGLDQGDAEGVLAMGALKGLGGCETIKGLRIATMATNSEQTDLSFLPLRRIWRGVLCGAFPRRFEPRETEVGQLR